MDTSKPGILQPVIKKCDECPNVGPCNAVNGLCEACEARWEKAENIFHATRDTLKPIKEVRATVETILENNRREATSRTHHLKQFNTEQKRLDSPRRARLATPAEIRSGQSRDGDEPVLILMASYVAVVMQTIAGTPETGTEPGFYLGKSIMD